MKSIPECSLKDYEVGEREMKKGCPLQIIKKECDQ